MPRIKTSWAPRPAYSLEIRSEYKAVLSFCHFSLSFLNLPPTSNSRKMLSSSILATVLIVTGKTQESMHCLHFTTYTRKNLYCLMSAVWSLTSPLVFLTLDPVTVAILRYVPRHVPRHVVSNSPASFSWVEQQEGSLKETIRGAREII